MDQSSARRQVKRLVDVYQKLLKNKKKDQPKAIKDRESFLSDLIYEQALDIVDRSVFSFHWSMLLVFSSHSQVG